MNSPSRIQAVSCSCAIRSCKEVSVSAAVLTSLFVFLPPAVGQNTNQQAPRIASVESSEIGQISINMSGESNAKQIIV